MTNTDEALVAEAEALNLRSSTSQFARMLEDRQGGLPEVKYTIALLDEHEAMNRRLCERLSALLSQPPSGGWDDVAVERASVAFMEKWTKGSWSFLDIEVCKVAMRAALNAAAPRESLGVEPPPVTSESEALSQLRRDVEAVSELRSYAESVWFDEARATDEEHEIMHNARVAIRSLEERTRDGSSPQTLSPAPRGEEGWVQNAAVTIAEEIMRQASRATVRGRSGMHVSVNEHSFDCEKIARLLAAAPKAPDAD